MGKMSIDDETLIEIISEEDFHNIPLFNKVAKRVFSIRDPEIIRMLLRKLRFSFLANDESYRLHILESLSNLAIKLSRKKLVHICVDTLVGNYLIILVLSKQNPVLNVESAENFVDVMPHLVCIEDLYLFGFPYQGQIFLEIDERIENLKQEVIKKLITSCNILNGIGLFQKSRETVESFRNLYNASGKPEDHLRAKLVSSLLQRDFNQFSEIMERFGYKITTEKQIIAEYSELWKHFERLSIPIFLDIRNLRFNRVLYNGNFYFLRYKNFEGKEELVYPFSQVDLSEVNKIYDPKVDLFYTPRERYGRLLLSDIYSFREVQRIGEPNHKSVKEIASMSEDEIESRIRKILKDANLTSHSPVELADVLTLNLFVNNPDDLRLSGFIIKGQSFGVVHLNTIAGQLLQVSHSPVEMVFLIHVPSIDDRGLRYFIQECESKQKNYCVVDRNDLACLFRAYDLS